MLTQQMIDGDPKEQNQWAKRAREFRMRCRSQNNIDVDNYNLRGWLAVTGGIVFLICMFAALFGR